MKARVTQTDIAQMAGVHNTTVSLSLRNSRLIPDATRKRIQAIAESMGYRRDPALTALVAYRNSRRSQPPADTLAYITNWETKWGWRDQPSHEKYYFGAQKGAAESGYKIEHFWLGERGMSPRRLSDMLLNRGISGVLLASHQAISDDLSEIDWLRLAAVKIGCFPHVPAINQIAIDEGRVVRLAIQRIRAAGYKRIGLVIPQNLDCSADRGWSRAFFAEQCTIPHRERLPVLSLHGPHDLSRTDPKLHLLNDDRAFLRWYRENRPEVILGVGPLVLARIKQVGLSVPQNVSYVDLFLDGSCGIAGIRHDCERVGELAVETLARQLQQNLFGIPEFPTITSISGTWVDGMSLPEATSIKLGEIEPMAPEQSRNALAV